MSVNTLGCTHLYIDLYSSTMMTLYREQATSRSNLKIGYVGKSIITMFVNVVKNFILSKPIDFLFLSSLLCINTKEK
jgi:hypothetical protein